MPSYDLEDTIAAVATPPGMGGIGIIRVAGPRSLPLIQDLARPVYKGHDGFPSHVCVLCDLIGPKGRVLDRALVTRFAENRSYTGDEQVEISCHGSPLLLQTILDMILKKGARLAERGEFTRRAFLNGRIDLTQAEAVLDLIRTRSREGLAAAAAELTGALSLKIEAIRKDLMIILARLELAVDFPEDELPQTSPEEILPPLRTARRRIEALLENAESGRLLTEGVKAAIIGRPNVGKSSLYNALLGSARAIVTEIPGTTRDALEAAVQIGGVAFLFYDTAGLRETTDRIESAGIGITNKIIEEADLILAVIDASEPMTTEDRDLLALTARKTRIVVMNKTDCPRRAEKIEGELLVSALKQTGLEALQSSLLKMTVGEDLHSENFLTRKRHVQRLRQCRDSLILAENAFADGEECTALEIREALSALSALVGETTPEDVLEAIFEEFCIGK